MGSETPKIAALVVEEPTLWEKNAQVKLDHLPQIGTLQKIFKTTTSLMASQPTTTPHNVPLLEKKGFFSLDVFKENERLKWALNKAGYFWRGGEGILGEGTTLTNHEVFEQKNLKTKKTYIQRNS